MNRPGHRRYTRHRHRREESISDTSAGGSGWIVGAGIAVVLTALLFVGSCAYDAVGGVEWIGLLCLVAVVAHVAARICVWRVYS